MSIGEGLIAFRAARSSAVVRELQRDAEIAPAQESLHGLQVGVAAYLVSLLQQNQSAMIGTMLERTGFWDEIAADPFSTAEWLEAVRRAPTLKENFFTILSARDTAAEVEAALRTDPHLRRCFTD